MICKPVVNKFSQNGSKYDPRTCKTIIERTYFWSIALAIADFDEPPTLHKANF